MELLNIFNGNDWVYNWVILPLLIVIARISDQTIGTLRLIFLAKGHKRLAPVLGFFEVIIWLLVISQIIQNLNNVLCFIAYGLGFALGNYLGLVIEEKLSLGNVIIRVIPRSDSEELVSYLKSLQYHVTAVDTVSATGKVKMIFSVISRKDLKNITEIIQKFNPDSFISVEDVKVIGESEPKTGFQQKFRFFRGMLKK
ncbi:MAG TPA: DUF2179 domain-containing protein [Bacteroidia bacterium]|nr:DUF2179 domain-containing protein [Bacteroidia bacterium]HRS58504.1 DUF2179 domain-containing protein [Bacteroidia bacterium]HRU68535.1 DUF2179 domain-containing protein [Bacteroidia bacterium]